MTRLWLIRHGETDWNIEGRWQGQAPHAPPLNAAGRAQSEALVEQLNSHVFDALYSSDLLRAAQTAAIVGARLGLRVQVEPRLREINQGEWEGMLGRDIARVYPAAWAARERDPASARPPSGESVVEVAARAWAAADAITRQHPGGAVLVVSHGLLLATLICRARGLPLRDAHSLIPANARPDIIDWSVDE